MTHHQRKRTWFLSKRGAPALLLLALCLAVLGAALRGGDAASAQTAPFTLAITHTGSGGTSDFRSGSTDGSVGVTLTGVNTTIPVGRLRVAVTLRGDLTYLSTTLLTVPDGAFACSAVSTTVTCSNNVEVNAATGIYVFTFGVQAPVVSTSTGPFSLTATAFLLDTGDVYTVDDLVQFRVTAPTPTPSITPTASVTPTRTPTLTLTFGLFPTITPLGTSTIGPTATPIPSATLIPNLPTRTPVPRPANAGLAIGPLPRPGVRVVVDRDNVNIRVLPAIGADVVAFVNAGSTYDILARSPDSEWVQVIVGNQLGWLGTAVVAIIAGDLNAAPVADPRTIPYGGFENPRSGITSATSAFTGKLENSGLRVRGGPGLGYPVLANAPRYTVFPLLGKALGGSWLQVNFEGTLGWVATEFVNVQQGLGIIAGLPDDGIVSEGVTSSEPTTDSYNDTLRLLLARVELAQPSLDEIRAVWTRIAIGERAACGSYPARPSDTNIPNPVLAPFYGTLFPLQEDFNAAMAYLRLAIDLFIDICGRPQPAEGYVGQAVVQNALDAINAADALFASLRARLRALLPPDQPLTDDQCLFTYSQRSEVLDRLRLNTPRSVTLTDPNKRVIGLCFDAAAGQTLTIQGLKVSGNAQPRLTVTSFDNPTNFIGVAEFGSDGTTAFLSNLLFTQTGRYLLLISDLDAGSRGVRLNGEIAVLLTDTAATLSIDPVTGQVVVNQGGAFVPSATPFGFTGGVSTPGASFSTPVSGVVCPSVTFTCNQLFSCDEAVACLVFNPSLDPDRNGIPCANLCGS